VTEAKKKGPFSFLTDLISDEVPDKPAGPPRNTPLPPPPPGHVVQPTFAAPDQKALAMLEGRLNTAVPAPYAAFMEMYQSLAEDIPDESKRMKVALKTSKTTAEQISACLDQLVGTMETVHQEFLHSQQEKLEAHQALDASIQAKEEQLQHLQAEIQALRERSTSEQSKIEQVRMGFEAAHSQVVGRLQAQKSKIVGVR
jgi:predicted  nucleic acid-binding Zn-ribbon protein